MEEKVLIDKTDLVSIADKVRLIKKTADQMTFNEMYTGIIDDIAIYSSSSEDTIYLENNIENKITIIEKNVTLDLNGHELTSNYIICYGNIIDSSENKEGLICVDADKAFLRSDNEYLPVQTSDGYHFIKIEKINATFRASDGRYLYQPVFEKSAHSLLIDITNTGIKIGVFVQSTAKTTNKYYYFNSNEKINEIIASYDEESGRYGRMYSFGLSGDDNSDVLYSVYIEAPFGVKVYSPTTAHVESADS